MSNKRLLHEIKRMMIEQNQKSLLENEYLVHFDETNMNRVQTIIRAPFDSVYRHKFIRLDFEIPEDYPHSPPTVTFVNYDSVRIHPNMYEDGKCCSTILNTWPSDNEKWTSSMGIETVLLTFRSFLDNNPYTFEPGGRDDPTYTDYVLFQSWKTCLIRYLGYPQPDLFTEYIYRYILENFNQMMSDIGHLEILYEMGYYETRCFEIDLYFVNYYAIKLDLLFYYNYIKEFYQNEESGDREQTGILENLTSINCHICFDTLETTSEATEILEVHPSHTFHKSCLIEHGVKNGLVCPLCRGEYSETIFNKKRKNDDTVINPETKRRIKIGGKVYQRLIEKGHFN